MSNDVIIPPPTKDLQFLNGIDLNSPAQMARSIAMQIRVRGHYQGQRSWPTTAACCVVASAAYGAADLDQRRRFDQALAKAIGDPQFKANGYSLVHWNDHTRTEVVLDVLDRMPFPDPPMEGTCDR